MNDILQATGYAALVYLLFNYLITFGSGRPLVEWINPGRKYLPLLALALFGGAYTSLRYASAKHDETQLELLIDLVGKEKAKPEVVGAVSFLTFGLAIVMTYLWCWMFLPRGAETFSRNPKDLNREYRRALRHYVRWSGGLDFAALCKVKGDELRVVAEGTDDRHILRGLSRLPALTGQNPPTLPAVEEQKQLWRDLALDLYQKWPETSKLLLGARQGKAVSISFDVRFGAIYAEMIEEDEDPSSGARTAVFLFAATLNEHEVGNLNAAKHFNMLSQAIRHIRSGVVRG